MWTWFLSILDEERLSNFESNSLAISKLILAFPYDFYYDISIRYGIT